jgi:tRNA nucleotidyltransferase (CCA-adding enzyme)
MSLTPNSRHNLPTFEQLSNGLGGGSLAVLESLRRRATEDRLPCYLVGGPVRDLLLGVPLRDLDVSIERDATAEGDATALAAVLAEELGAKLTIHRRFGTATLTLSGEHVDLVTARKEVYPRPGALPKVSPGTIIDDLARRDFSVNAIALPLSAARSGVVDPHGGVDDLERRIIRTLHYASFVDDPTRMMRAVRYERRLGFSLEDSTLDDLRGALASGAMATVSGDRWRRELDRILDEPRPIDALVRAIELGILAGIHPGLTRSDSIERIAASPHAGPDRFFAGLVYPLSEVEGEEVIRRLKLPKQRAKLVRDTISLRENESELKNTVSTPSKLVASLDGVDPEAVGAVAILTDAPRVRQGLDRYIAEFRTVSPRLTGEDLLAMRVIQGPEIGELLARLLDARLDGLVETVDDEREMARDWISRRQVVSQTT